MEKLAELYGVPVEEFLDEYSLFLHNGQGKQIIAARKNLKMTQQEFADKLGVRLDALKKWEKDRVVMHKSTWENISRRYDRNLAKQINKPNKQPMTLHAKRSHGLLVFVLRPQSHNSQ